MYKIIKGRPHPNYRNSNSKQTYEIGIAFRTGDAPLGYFPFYDEDDFDFSGETSWKEKIMANLPVDLSSVASPYTLLVQGAAADVEFLGSGNPDLNDIQREVRLDLTSHAMASASGVFVDGVMLAIGGAAIQSIVRQFTKSAVKRFLVSKAIGAGAKNLLKKQAKY